MRYIYRLTEKEIKALTKQELINTINKARKSKKVSDLKPLKRDELRHILRVENKKKPKKTAPKKTAQKKPRTAEQKKADNLRKKVQYRRSHIRTREQQEAYDLYLDMATRAETKEEKQKAMQIYVENPLSLFSMQNKEIKRLLEGLLDTIDEKNEIKIDKNGNIYIKEEKKKKTEDETIEEETAEEKRKEKRKEKRTEWRRASDSATMWKVFHRIKEMFPFVPSGELVNQAKGIVNGYNSFDNVIASLNAEHVRQEEETENAYKNFGVWDD